MIVLTCMFFQIDVSKLADIVSVGTPIVLLIWFAISRKTQLEESFYKDFVGHYGGFTEPIDKSSGIDHGGFLLRILNIDSNGYFLGEFDFGEIKTTISSDKRLSFQQMRDGIYTCLGKIDHEIYASEDRHPMKVDQNRIYKGKFYVVDRLDFQFKSYNFENYIQLEYDLIHYREMKVIELKLTKTHKEISQLPAEITAHKKIGLSHDVYESVKFSSFRDFYSRNSSV
ncbi:hypothetical protein WG904_12465 [Pedobacter sp. Du54]|uniref:hypothetical protein n=1 Tax=Pedobacter anseongensis TaxID=3133439 RepID=UPI0030990CCA